jgi:GTP-binding protein
MLFKQSLERISTGQLNKLVRAALEKHPPPMHGMVRPKIFYATQVSVQPPTIVLMCNEPRGFSEQYRRFLLRILRDNLKFGEVPIKMYLQRRRRDDKRNETGIDEDPAEKAVVEEGSDVEEFDEDYQEIDSELEEADEVREEE